MDNEKKSQIKITEDEQAEIVRLNAEFQNLLLRLGETSVEEINLKKELSELKKFRKNCKKLYNDLKNKENMFTDRLKNKYGEGMLDIESGIYISQNNLDKY